MLARVSGSFFDKDFTGRIALDEESSYQRSVVFDHPIKTWAGYIANRSSLSLRRGVEHEGTLEGLSFHKRHAIFIGDFCLGWVVDCGIGIFKAEPINHGRINPTGVEGKMTDPYPTWSDAFKFFHHSVGEGAHAHLRAAEQTIEHKLLREYKGK